MMLGFKKIYKTELARYFYVIIIVFITTHNVSYASNPLIYKDNLKYLGAFKFPTTSFGESSLSYADGTVAYNQHNHSLFIVGKLKEQAIGEYSIPELIKTTDIAQLNNATNIQPFIRALPYLNMPNPQSINRITGMIMFDNSLFVNAIKYYDAAAKNTDTSFLITNASNLEKKHFKGFYALSGGAHSAGWISIIPEGWQTKLGAKYLSGNASNTPISSRHSIGPSAFVIEDLLSLGSPPASIQATPLMDFNLKHKLHEDFYNESGLNNLWTVVSKAQYGFIIPGSNTYAVVGSSGGHHSKLGYKIVQNTGRRCPGPCPFQAMDYYNYIWFYNVDDLLNVKLNKLRPYQIKPYSFGKFLVPFDKSQDRKGRHLFHQISGGTFDEVKNVLYLSLKRADTKNNQPIIVAFKVRL